MPAELKKTKNGLINIKNNDQKYFLWCHVRHINPVKMHPERITLTDKQPANELHYDEIEFPVDKEDFSTIETINNIFINTFLTCSTYVETRQLFLLAKCLKNTCGKSEILSKDADR